MSADLVTAAGIRDAFIAGAVTATEVCQRALDRIRNRDAALRAFLAVDADAAMAQARVLDALTDRRAAGALAAVPVGIKDNLCTAKLATTAGSRLLDGYMPPADATAVRRLREAGAIVVGKTNCDEFGMGASTEHSGFGATRNPWDHGRTPGGSSGGSAAAVAARMVAVALGSDTGGSVRQPAGFCGIVGIRPTYGRVSRSGLIAFASSLDQVGTMALTVRDAALALQVIAGHDPRDATSWPAAVPDWVARLDGGLRGVRLGVPSRWLEEGVDPDVLACVREALACLQARGAVVVDVDLAHARDAVAVYHIVAMAEASSNLARYDGVRYGRRAGGDAGLREMYERTRANGFGVEVKRRVLLGTYVLGAGYDDQLYVKALQARTLITRDLDEALSGVDALVTPTSPTAAFPLGDRLDDPVRMYLADVFTAGAPLAGLPALSVPCGFTRAGLPVGLQMIGRRFDEGGILQLADAYERDQRWWTRVPPGLPDL